MEKNWSLAFSHQLGFAASLAAAMCSLGEAKPKASGLRSKAKYIKKCEKLNFVCKNVVFLQRNANVVQLVEHQLPKLRVAGSNPVIRSWDLIHFKGDAAERPHFLFHYVTIKNKL